MSDVVFVLLLTIHIAGVVFWLGAAAVYSMILGPTLADPVLLDSKPDFVVRVLSRYSKLIAVDSIITILAGFFLFDYVSTAATYLLPLGWKLLLIYAGAILGFVAFVVALAAVLPTSNRAIRILGGRVSEGNVSAERAASKKAVTVQSKLGSREELINSLHAIRGGLAGSSVLLGIVLVLMILGTNL